MTRRGSRAAPLAVLAVGSAFLLAVWAYFERREKEAAERQLSLLAEQVAARAEAVVHARLGLLRHLRRRWAAEREWKEDGWRALGEELRADFPGFQALTWIGADGRIRWIDPVEGNEAALGADLRSHPVVGPLFAAEDWPEAGRVSPPVELFQGGRGVVAYLPLERGGKRLGWVSGVFRIDDLMHTCLPKGAPSGHALRLVDVGTGGSLLTIGAADSEFAWEASAAAPLAVGDRTWRLVVAPERAVLEAVHATADEALAVGGFLLLLVAAALLRGVLRRGSELEESRSRYRSLVEGAPEAIVVLDASTGRFVEANARAEEMFGLDRSELTRLGPVDLSPPLQPDGRSTREAVREHVERALAGEEPAFEWVHVDVQGVEIPTEIHLSRLKHPRRELVRGTITDIRERLEADRALRESEAKYRRIVDTAHEGVWVIDEGGRTTFVNERMAEILGGRPEDVLGRSMYDFMEDEDRPIAERKLERRREGVDELHEFRFRRLDGSSVWTMLSTSPLTDDAGNVVGALAMVADITSQRELEEQLRQSQKMEAIGRLAGGIAHDFNNILTGVLGAADLLASRCTGDERSLALLEEIRELSERASTLTRQLLAFSRRQVVKPELVDLGALVLRVERVLQRLIGEEHELAVSAAGPPALVSADPAQLEQVILNLVVNARDAAPEGGRIHLRTSRLGSHRVLLEVEDEGPGVPTELRERIFEPFFTTKAEFGNGLGLSTVHGIVTQCGGTIEVLASAGGGALFRVSLPAAEGRPAAEDADAEAAAARSGLRILLVEDEVAVRRVVRLALEQAGHRVHVVGGGAEAVAVLQRSDFDLLLTDYFMPGMNGDELAERAVLLRPDLRVVLMTGYAQDPPVVAGRPDLVVLSKPFGAAQLLAAISRAATPQAG